MKNLVKTTLIALLLLITMPIESFSQYEYFNISVGSGITYGGIYGAMFSIKPSPNIAISGSIGEYMGPPLSWGSFDEDKNGDKVPLNRKTQTGMGYSVGLRISPNEVGYVGVQYINAGTLKYKDEERTLPGINLMMGGNHYFGYSRFFMDWSINLSFLFRDDVVGGMIGVSLGLGCEL